MQFLTFLVEHAFQYNWPKSPEINKSGFLPDI